MKKGEKKQTKEFKEEVTENKASGIVTVRPIVHLGKSYGIGAELIANVDVIEDLINRKRLERNGE